MSASRKKKERSQQRAEAAQGNAKAKKAGMSKEMRDTLIVVGVVVVVLAAFVIGMLIYNHAQERKLLQPDYDVDVAAATLGEQNISVPIMNYYYLTVVNSFYSSYGDYISIFFDPSVALDEQEYTGASFFGGDYETWDDYFMAQAEDSITEYYNLYQCAMDDGYTLSEDDQAIIDTAVSSVESAADETGFSSADLYLATVYGSGCTLENYKEFVEVQQIASSYYADFYNGIEISDEDIAAEYDANPDTYDGVNYYLFTSSAQGTTDADGNYVDPTEEEIQQAADDAQAMKDNFVEEDATAMNDRTKTSVSEGITEDAAEWLFDSARKEGDVELFSNEDDSVHYVVKFVSRDNHDYDTANVKLIYIAKSTSDDADDDTATPEKRYELLMSNLESDPSEENFDALIASDSEDSSVSSDNGVKTEVHKHTYSTEVDEWLFGGKAEVGTYRAFETDTGYYVFWFSGYGNNYRHDLVETSLISTANDEWLESHAHSNELVINQDMLQYVNNGIVISAES